jgi:hypothetical protein
VSVFLVRYKSLPFLHCLNKIGDCQWRVGVVSQLLFQFRQI